MFRMNSAKRKRQREQAEAEPAREAEEAAAKARKERKWDILSPILAVLVVAVVGVAAYFVVPLIPKPPTWEQNMERQAGIVNGRAVSILVADHVSTTVSGEGRFILIVGKSSFKQQDQLRMGISLPDGTVAIVHVPVSSIGFKPGPGEPSVKFHFDNWSADASLQDNIDTFLDHSDGVDGVYGVTVNLTLDELKRLIASS